MMTIKAFWKNPYQTELNTKISAINGTEVQLMETIFYAESGGQESDSGTINGIAVLEAKKSGQSIVYTLASTDGMDVGQPVTITIDWPRRYRLMKLHFAAELVLEIFYQGFPEVEKVGAHIAEDKSRIDFAWPESVNPLLPELQMAAQTLIDADLAIESEYSDEANERRYWKIDGFAEVPCGGTHLQRTAEVGQIQLKRKNIGKGKERIEIRLASA